jgi:Uma2 family endonuclease
MTLLTPPTSTRFTPADLLAMPDNAGMELVDGQIVEKEVSTNSSEVEGIILSVIRVFLLTHPVAKVFPASLGYTCFPDDPDKMRKPDVTVVSLSRLKDLPEGDTGYMPIVPDLAVEVLSPNDVIYNVDKKIDEYFSAGFPLLWIADPIRREITVHPLKGRPVIFTADDEITAQSALPGFRCKVSEFFPPITAVAP